MKMLLPESLLSREIGVVESFQVIVLLFWSKLLLFPPNLNSRFIESRCYTRLGFPPLNTRFYAKRTDNNSFSSRAHHDAVIGEIAILSATPILHHAENRCLHANYWRLCRLDSFLATL